MTAPGLWPVPKLVLTGAWRMVTAQAVLGRTPQFSGTPGPGSGTQSLWAELSWRWLRPEPAGLDISAHARPSFSASPGRQGKSIGSGTSDGDTGHPGLKPSICVEGQLHVCSESAPPRPGLPVFICCCHPSNRSCCPWRERLRELRRLRAHPAARAETGAPGWNPSPRPRGLVVAVRGALACWERMKLAKLREKQCGASGCGDIAAVVRDAALQRHLGLAGRTAGFWPLLPRHLG